MVNVLMVGSSTKTNGGIATVVKNMITYRKWQKINLKFISTYSGGSLFCKTTTFLFACFKILFTLFFSKIDIIYIHMSMNGSFSRAYMIYKFAKIKRKKVIVHHHGSNFSEFYENSSEKKKKRISTFLTNATCNIVLSKKNKEILQAISPDVKIEIVHNSVDVPPHNLYNPEGNYILFLGRLCQRKGVYDLLASIEKIKDSIPTNTKFILCGDGELENVKQFIQNQNISRLVEVKGWINNQIIKDSIFDNTILNVLPSYFEGLPMTILETMARGIPNISTNIFAIPEVINSDNGVLINPGQVDELSQNILRLILDMEERIRLSQNAYCTINELFNIDRNYESLEILICEMVGG